MVEESNVLHIHISYYPLPSGMFRDNLQHCVGDFARLLVVQFTINEVEL